MVKQTRRCRKRKQRGGEPVMVDVRQITITEPICAGIQALSGAPPPEYLKRAKGHQGFPLPRLENFRNKNIRANLEQYPIEVDTIRNKDGIAFGITIDSVKKPIYTIRNGRHRFTKAIAEGLTVIPAIVIS